MNDLAFEENLIKKMGGAALRKIQGTRVGIAGAGGLGSNCAINLVRSGFKKLTIADFDVVAPSNLDRQAYFGDQIGMKKVAALRDNLLRINPELELETSDVKVERENVHRIFRDCAVVVECFDRAGAKSMLVSELLPSGKLVVAASGLGGVGNSDDIQVHRIKENLVLIGDLRSDIEGAPALSPRVNVAAAKQADAVLEFVINKTGN